MVSRPCLTIPRVFADSSVLFAAAYSRTGSAYNLLQTALARRVRLVLSELVLEETERNISENAPEALSAFEQLRVALPFLLSNPSEALLLETAAVIAPKDAAIVAGARRARTKLLATYDRKHLLGRSTAIQSAVGITVATPQHILTHLNLARSGGEAA